MATKDKGSLARLIARAKEAQGTDSPSDQGVTASPPVEPQPAAVETPAPPPAQGKATPAKAEKQKPAAKKKPGRKPKPALSVPEPAADRRIGRRGNPDYRQANAYIPKSLHLRVKRALLEEGDREFSSLVEELLEKWAAEKGV